jgi:hypothetical protein
VAAASAAAGLTLWLLDEHRRTSGDGQAVVLPMLTASGGGATYARSF